MLNSSSLIWSDLKLGDAHVMMMMFDIKGKKESQVFKSEMLINHVKGKQIIVV